MVSCNLIAGINVSSTDPLIGDWRISLLVECLFILYFSLIGLLKERMQLSCLLGANYD